MSERISALMDGEMDPGETTGEIAQLGHDAQSRSSWETYHLIGDALRGDIRPSLGEKLSIRLAAEPTVLAPRRRAASVGQYVRYALSAAAGISGVALVFWMAGSSVGPVGQSEVASTVLVPQSNANSPTKPGMPEVQTYLFAHQQTAAGVQSITPVGWTSDRAAENAR